jgi:hypothetical protein
MDPSTPPSLPPGVSRDLFDMNERHANERHVAVMAALARIEQGQVDHTADDVIQFGTLGRSVAVLQWAVGIIGAGAIAGFAWLLTRIPN